MNVTRHFQARAQQRCISVAMVDLILDYGSSNSKGDVTLLGRKEIDKRVHRNKQEIQAYEQEIQRRKQENHELEKMRSRGGAGIAHDGETLITAFHRHKKFKRG